ncbi:hypothetical protein BaRGS_00015263 [Batillaria attramentaria]|uniref:Uncharacterized protein n=1 Tax=Batillaria attramentaria TaxID=370345 RepID=A0ABD0L2D3_9CAEN
MKPSSLKAVIQQALHQACNVSVTHEKVKQFGHLSLDVTRNHAAAVHSFVHPPLVPRLTLQAFKNRDTRQTANPSQMVPAFCEELRQGTSLATPNDRRRERKSARRDERKQQQI